MTKFKIFFAIYFIGIFHVYAQNDFLLTCWDKQVKPIGTGFLTFSFQENLNRLNHSFEPWQQTNYSVNGKIWCNGNSFVKQDTLKNGQRVYYSKMSANRSELLLLDYGDKSLFAVTKEMFMDRLISSARYNPVNLIEHFRMENIGINEESNSTLAVYSTIINQTTIKLYIDKSTALLRKITALSYDDLYGDVLTTISYSDYSNVGILFYPKQISIDKINGQLHDELTLTNVTLTKNAPSLLERPANYQHEPTVKKKPEIKTERFNDNIHFVELKHTDDKVMIVEFADFLLVAEAPVNSSNGELIIAEARRIAPGKPLKYFVFGHYHPHYLGGIRPFIHKGAKIITSKMDRAYVTYL
ncbi:MAG: hypothetical protein RIF39_16830, partial [Cyclobacteriaceae bacterium]